MATTSRPRRASLRDLTRLQVLKGLQYLYAAETQRAEPNPAVIAALGETAETVLAAYEEEIGNALVTDNKRPHSKQSRRKS